MDTLEDYIRVALRCGRNDQNRKYLDPAEIDSLSYLCAWKIFKRGAEVPNKHAWIRVTLKRMIIDEIRLQRGRKGQKNFPLMYDFVLKKETIHYDQEYENIDQTIKILSGGKKRTEYILRRLADGDTKVSIAKDLGIDQSMISIILREVRLRKRSL